MNSSNIESTQLKKAFKDSGYTYQELAGILGISSSYCYKIINNDKYKKNVYYSLASQIAGVFKRDIVDLFEE
ncbi:transcriptional regulator [Bacillus mycoides]|uniref:Transcriptional regulator n=1 Tax=Bacillus mycoides TaxID=1405 RepID=A0A1W6A3T1_BACMY|nr:helix-turn-helix transcriptional regulator [Bacillus mycoides]ARJ20488.1 transcriptional regulator [Bacillus mycoides]